MKNKVLADAKAIFRGFGQIMLQGNMWTGLLFIGAIFYDSTVMGVAGILSNLIGTYSARMFRFDESDIKNGLYGFNASLFGIALVFYFQHNVWIWLTLALGSVLTTLLTNLGIKQKIPLFTFPFILVTWVALYLLSIPALGLPTVVNHFVDITDMDDFLIQGHAFGQVIFQGSVVAGIVFFIGVFLSNPVAALYGLFAVLISVYVSHRSNASQQLITDGIMSFNAVLCGIALSGQRVRDGVYVFLAVIVCTYVDHLMIHNGWTTLTFPFVLTMWIIVLLKKAETVFLNKFPVLTHHR